jgi:hypothetical protein
LGNCSRLCGSKEDLGSAIMVECLSGLKWTDGQFPVIP